MTRALLALVLLASACAGAERPEAAAPARSSTTPTVVETTTTAAVPARRDPERLEVTLYDYEIRLATTTVTAGAYELAVANTDRAPHDVVLLETSLGLTELPTTGIRVDELDKRLSIRARTETIDAGGKGSLVITLRPGRYVLVCTVPHHYVRDLMAVELTGSAARSVDIPCVAQRATGGCSPCRRSSRRSSSVTWSRSLAGVI